MGGKSKVEMARLKLTFENLGFTDVKTYINSGNVIFKTKSDRSRLARDIEAAIEADLKLNVPVITRDLQQMRATVKALPANWTNDDDSKCDVIFLWKEVDAPVILEQIPCNPDMEEIKYVPGAVLWRIDRNYASKSKVLKLAGTDLYRKMTVRNCNTVRKLCALMQEQA